MPGADVDAADGQGLTPLHFAVNGDRIQIIEALLEVGADLDKRDMWGITALHRAATLHDPRATALLLRAGAAVNLRSRGDDGTFSGGTPLEYSIRACNGGVAYGQGVLEQHRRPCPLLLRAGAFLPNEDFLRNYPQDLYIHRVVNAGGWASYERLHLDRLARMFAPRPDGGRRRSRRRRPNRLGRLPPELIRRVVGFWAHAGFY